MFTELYEVVAVQKTTLKDCSNHVGQFFLAKKSNFMDFGSYRRFLAILAHCVVQEIEKSSLFAIKRSLFYRLYTNDKKISLTYPLDQNFSRNPMVQLIFWLDHVLLV